jgi:gamma-glutamyltranspeptidase/glutathione hydrolase
VSESLETTHYSIIDSDGNAVSVTTTLNANYGSKLLVPSLGFFLNNEMDDFSSKPGVPNLYGVIGGQVNAIAPNKRMLSSMTPTLIEQEDKLSMILGSPGGSTIITSVLQTIINVYDFKKNIQAAVEAPRFHHQWLPDSIKYEVSTFEVKTKNTLQNKGFHFYKQPTIIGRVDAIKIHKDGSFSGGADPRGDDSVSGF